MKSIWSIALPLVCTAASKGATACRERQNARRAHIGVLVFAAVLMLGSRPASAQNTGTIFGSVQDATGAVIPDASVVVTDATHGLTRTVKSNGAGEYLMPLLPVGVYTLTVSSPQFESQVVTNIAVDANSDIKEVVSLKLGSSKETVTVVDSSGTAIDANSATLGTLIDTKLIEDLPIDGHNAVALSALLPGVVDVNAPTTTTGDTTGPTYSASGSRNTQNLMLFDGLMWNNLFFNTGINYPPPNALQEVSVQLNNYKAEYGRNAGSVFNVVTRAGSNTIRGTVWDYIQNSYFNAADYISKVNPKDNINQWGFTIGAPIVKDKLFVFGAFQGLIGRLQNTGEIFPIGYASRGLEPDGVTPRPCTSPGPFPAGMSCASFAPYVFTAASGLGKFVNPVFTTGNSNGATFDNATSMLNAAYQQAGGSGQSPCLALLTQAAAYAAINAYGSIPAKVQPTYMPNAEIPVQCLNPVMLNIVNAFTPALQNAGNGLDAETQSNAPTTDQNALVRTDYTFNGQHSFDARYNLIHSTAVTAPGLNSSSQGVGSYATMNASSESNFGNVGWKWVIAPNLLSDMRFGYKRFESKQFPMDNRTLNDFGGNFVETGTPTLPVFSFSNQFTLGSTTQGFQDHINENVELNESLSWSKGNHSIKGGFQFLRLQYLQRADYPGQISFNTTFTGVSIADGMMGLANSVLAQNRLIQGGIQHNVFLYLQDDWRMTPRMTVNYGMRYELPFQWFEPHGQSATFVPGIQSTVFPQAPGGLGFPGDHGVLPSLVPTDFHGIAPRLGFAYDTTGEGKLLIRGGFGVFFDAVNANVVGVGEPYHFILNRILPPGGASVPLAGLGPNGALLQIPGAYTPSNPQFVGPYSIFFPDKNFRTPYVEAMNLGFQWHIPHAGTLETNYVGKLARKLTVPLDLNPAIADINCGTSLESGYGLSNPSVYCTAPYGNASSSAGSTQARLRYSTFNYGGQGIVDILSVGTSNYNALQEQYTQRGGRYLTIFQTYTYSRSLDIQSNGQTIQNAVPDVFNLNSDYGLSDNNAKHNLTLAWVVRFPKMTTGYAPLRTALNNWVYSGRYQAHTGRPFSVTINNDTALVGENNQRAALVAGASPLLPSNRHRADKVKEYFNIDAFTYPQIGTFSNVTRNAFVGPGYIMTDMALARDFPLARLREGMRLNIRAEAFNVFNTPNLNTPYAQFSCSSTSISTTSSSGIACAAPNTYGGLIAGTAQTQFGRVLSTYGNNGNTSTNGRKMQFSITIYY
jgi:hypothetical protein